MTQALHSARLDLEPVSPSHAAEAWPQTDDDRMWTYFPELRPATRDALRAQYERWERGSPDAAQVWLNWLCRDRSTHALVGSMQATVFPDERCAYLAYAVYPAHQRRGYAAEASRCVIEHLRGTYHVQRILAEMDVRNEASFRLAESLGFKRMKREGNSYIYELASAPLTGKSAQGRSER